MKPIRAMLAAPLLSITLALPAAAAPQRVVHVGRDTMESGLIAVTILKRQTLAPGIPAYGRVIDPAPAIRAREAILRAEAAERLAAATLVRTRHLYHAAGNVSEAELQQTEAQAAAAEARLDGLKAVAIARFGAALGRAIIEGDRRWQRIAAGGALISVVHDGPELPSPPKTAYGTAPDGARVMLRAIGPSGHLPRGLVGQAFYFSGPHLPAGTTIDVSIDGRHAETGYAVPVSALIYRGDEAYAFAETGKNRFVETTVPLNWPIWSHGAIAAYFVRTALLPKAGIHTGAVVTRGAGLVRSVAAGGHGPAPGTDHD